jgi:hypothetical protein
MTAPSDDYSKQSDAQLHAIAREGAAPRAGLAQAELERRRRTYEDGRDSRRHQHEMDLFNAETDRDTKRKTFEERLAREQMANAERIADKQAEAGRGVEKATKRAMWAAWASALGTTGALLIGAYQAYEAREHDHASVKPLVSFTYELDDDQPVVGLSIANAGLGPAIVKSISAYIDGKRVEGWREAVISGKVWRENSIRTNVPNKDDVLKPGETIFLLARPTNDKADLDQFIDFLRTHLGASVEFCSIYDNCWTTCSLKGRCGEELSQLQR